VAAPAVATQTQTAPAAAQAAQTTFQNAILFNIFGVSF
jgi:hypothetical protein